MSQVVVPAGSPSIVTLHADLARQWASVLETGLVDCRLRSAEEAELALEAFGQWFLALPRCRTDERLVMLKGPVDRMWHALLLHTSLYRSLCERHLGFFLDHQPQPGSPPQAWVRDTKRVLTRCYGAELHPMFDQWWTATTYGNPI